MQGFQVRFARESSIERFEPLRRIKENRRALATATDVQRDPPAKSLGDRALQPVHWRGRCGFRAAPVPPVATREVLCLCRRQCSPGAPGAVGCQRRCPLEEGRGCRHAATRLRSVGRALQLGREIRVSAECSLRSVPRSAVRVCLRVGCLSQRAVDGLPVGERSGAIDRRAHERVLKPNLRGEFDQADRLRWHGRFDAQPDQLRCRMSERRIAHRLGRGEEQEPLGLVGHRPDPSEEALLEASGEWLRRAHSEPARELDRRQSARELEQCQRIPARLGDDPVYYPLIDAADDREAEHPASVFVIQAAQD